MILHIFNASTFSDQFIECSGRLANYEEMVFIVLGKSRRKLSSQISAVYFDLNKINYSWIRKQCKMADRIVLHSMSKPFRLIVMFAIHKSFLKKLTPVFWGGDLYELNTYIQQTHGIKKLMNRIRYVLLKHIYKTIPCVGCLIPEDFTYFRTIYKTHAQYFPIVYSMEYFQNTFVQMLKTISPKHTLSNPIRICIGHSGNRTLRHIDTMKAIGKFANIEMCLPLSYGDAAYIKEIDTYIHTSNKNIKVLKDFMQFSEYCNLCNSMDMLIINSNRQIALGNIYLFLLLEKYVCIPKTSAMYHFLHDELGLDLLAYETFVASNEIIDLSSFTIDKEKNKKIMAAYVSEGNFIKLWNAFLNR